MPWICNACNAEYEGREDDEAPRCYKKEGCKKMGPYACRWQAPKVAIWTSESGKLTANKNAQSDLDTLIKAVSGNIYSTAIGTVVGGTGIKGKSAKKVSGLDDPSARIDIQNPPGEGVYNLGFQTGDKSHACALFTDDDKQDVVLKNLMQSLKECKKRISPSAAKILGIEIEYE